MRTNLFAVTLAAGWLIAGVTPGQAAEPRSIVQEEVLEWFEAEKEGRIEIKFVPKDATEATIRVRNLTDAPLRLRLPEAFAAVPVNAQMMGGMGMGGGGMGGMGGGGMGGMGGGGMGGMGGGMQGMGGGMGGMGGGGMGGMGGGGMGGMGGMGGGMGMMRVPAQREMKMKVTTVCLEHGKADPHPKVAYKMIPAEQFTEDPRVLEVCRLLGYNRMSQNIAQAAAWHLTDGLGWSELASKIKSEDGFTRQVTMWFHPREIYQASLVVASTNHLVNDDSAASTAREAGRYDNN